MQQAIGYMFNLFCRINPVTGHWEESRPDPMEGMSDEQKEYEAEKLMVAMDKLHRFVVFYFICH